MRNLGIVIIVLGILMTVFTGFNLYTKKEVVDLGSIKISATEKTPIYWSPITGLILIAVGGIIVFADTRKKR